jgi:hypothetical protein
VGPQSEALEEQVETLTRRNKELSWQVKMSAEGGEAGGAMAPAAGVAIGGVVKNWLVGCTAPRKPLPPSA